MNRRCTRLDPTWGEKSPTLYVDGDRLHERPENEIIKGRKVSIISVL